jgi:hypothetical protein
MQTLNLTPLLDSDFRNRVDRAKFPRGTRFRVQGRTDPDFLFEIKRRFKRDELVVEIDFPSWSPLTITVETYSYRPGEPDPACGSKLGTYPADSLPVELSTELLAAKCGRGSDLAKAVAKLYVKLTTQIEAILPVAEIERMHEITGYDE